MTSKKTLIFVCIAIVAVVVCAFAYRSYEHTEEVPYEDHASSTTGILVPGPISVEGKQVCLTRRNTTQEETMECAMGFEDDSGKHYALTDTSAEYANIEVMQGGERVRIEGEFTPYQDLAEQEYDAVGSIAIANASKIHTTGASKKRAEGEEPIQSPITFTSWEWKRLVNSKGETVTPQKSNEFVLSFGEDNHVMSTTDCNSLSGTYVVDGEVLSFTPFMTTLMFCDGSQQREYGDALAQTGSFVIVGDELRLILLKDAGIMFFERKD